MTTMTTTPAEAFTGQFVPVQEAAKMIRRQLKAELGLTSRQVSVRCQTYSIDSAIDVTIKSQDAAGLVGQITAIANNQKKVHWCELTGECLGGGNRFVDVTWDRDVEKKMVESLPVEITEPEQGSVTTAGRVQIEKTDDDSFCVGLLPPSDSTDWSDDQWHTWDTVTADGMLAATGYRAGNVFLWFNVLVMIAKLRRAFPELCDEATSSSDHEEEDCSPRATYCIHLNELRVYPHEDIRLDKDTRDQLSSCGFRWAPVQRAFLAKMWTPEREDLALALCGEIEDETVSPEERAAERANRFTDRAIARTQELHAERTQGRELLDVLAGQPILIGHHSERATRRAYAKIDRSIGRQVQLFRCAEYWSKRAEAAKQHHLYKEAPSVRANRIKKLEADRRKCERNQARATTTRESERLGRWIAHYRARVAFERELLGDWEPPKPKRKTAPPIRNYKADTITVSTPIPFPTESTLEQVSLTRQEWKAIDRQYKGTRTTADGSHRVRVTTAASPGWRMTAVFLSDAKTHPLR